MSKASRYASELAAAKERDLAPPPRPTFCAMYRGEFYEVAHVTAYGFLQPTSTRHLMASEVRAFAAWLQDTFGEPTPKVPNE